MDKERMVKSELDKIFAEFAKDSIEHQEEIHDQVNHIKTNSPEPFNESDLPFFTNEELFTNESYEILIYTKYLRTLLTIRNKPNNKKLVMDFLNKCIDNLKQDKGFTIKCKYLLNNIYKLYYN